jgi:hypothetical protein
MRIINFSPAELAKKIFESTFSSQEKKKILDSLPYLSESELTSLYIKLDKLSKHERQVPFKMKAINAEFQADIKHELKNS